MAGQGTIISGREGQTSAKCIVNALATNQPSDHLGREVDIEVSETQKAEKGELVGTTYDRDTDVLSFNGVTGSRGIGLVEKNDTTNDYTITVQSAGDEGDTQFTVGNKYDINISDSYDFNGSNNQGFEASNAYFSPAYNASTERLEAGWLAINE